MMLQTCDPYLKTGAWQLASFAQSHTGNDSAYTASIDTQEQDSFAETEDLGGSIADVTAIAGTTAPPPGTTPTGSSSRAARTCGC